MASWAYKAALALCAINPIAVLTVVGWDRDPLGMITQAVAFAISLPVISCLQLFGAWVVRKEASPWTQVPILLISLAAAINYAWFVFTVDLTTSSTAGIGLILYPIMRQSLWALPIGAAAFWIGRSVEAR